MEVTAEKRAPSHKMRKVWNIWVEDEKDTQICLQAHATFNKAKQIDSCPHEMVGRKILQSCNQTKYGKGEKRGHALLLILGEISD